MDMKASNNQTEQINPKPNRHQHHRNPPYSGPNGI